MIKTEAERVAHKRRWKLHCERMDREREAKKSGCLYGYLFPATEIDGCTAVFNETAWEQSIARNQARYDRENHG